MKKTLKIRNSNEVYNKITTDISWRRAEILILRAAVTKSKNIKQDAYTRAGIAILYAHWEGFSKYAANIYASYLTTISLRYNEVLPCFRAVPMKGKIDYVFESKKPYRYAEVLTEITNMDEQNVSIKIGKYIENVGNLNYDLLVGILSCLGIDPKKYKSKENFIDEILLNSRNEIAHGQYLQINENDFLNISDNVLTLIEMIADDFITASSVKSYRSDYVLDDDSIINIT